MGDQLVTRPLLTAPGVCDDGEIGRMNGFGRRNKSTRRKPVQFVHQQSHMPDLGANPGRRGGKPETKRFSYGEPDFFLINAIKFTDQLRICVTVLLKW
jgi:hypothetical protein